MAIGLLIYLESRVVLHMTSLSFTFRNINLAIIRGDWRTSEAHTGTCIPMYHCSTSGKNKYLLRLRPVCYKQDPAPKFKIIVNPEVLVTMSV